VKRRQRVRADHLGRALDHIADADDGGQVIDLVVATFELVPHRRVSEIADGEVDVGPPGQGREVVIACTSREIVQKRHLVRSVIGESLGEVVADEARAAGDQDPTSAHCSTS